MTNRQGMPGSGGAGGHETDPVFADPSGQRRRLMLLLGAGASVLLVGALIVVGIGLFGGPNTPFSVFGKPAASGHGHLSATARDGRADRSAPGQRTPGSAGGTQQPGSPTAPARSASPSPSTSRHSSPTPSPSPTTTNSAGKTPPGRNRTKKPHPSPSPHAR